MLCKFSSDLYTQKKFNDSRYINNITSFQDLEDYMRKNLKSSVTIPNSMSLYDMLRNTVLMILSPVINMNNYKSV